MDAAPTQLANADSCRYQFDIDLGTHNAHAAVLRFLGYEKRVLELGCATGYMSKILYERGCEVVAIEIDRCAARHAAAFCRRVIVGDLDHIDIFHELCDEQFDVVVAADVLEHLKYPTRVLKQLHRHLLPEGYVVASIPNVAHGSVRLALLGGRFPYAELGLLDRTHLRFYTLETIQELFAGAGFLLETIERIEKPLERSEVDFDRRGVSTETWESLSKDPDSLTYQYVVVARRAPDAASEPIFRRPSQSCAIVESDVTEPPRPDQPQILQADGHGHRHGAQAQHLSNGETACDDVLSDLQRVLGERTQQRDDHAEQLRDLQIKYQQQFDRLQRQTDTTTQLRERQRELRSMLLQAHEQLLCRDQELQVSLAGVLKSSDRPGASSHSMEQVGGKHLKYQRLVHELRKAVCDTVPQQGVVAVISKGDGALVDLEGRKGWHFPRTETGVYAGHHPADSDWAIAHLETLRERGAQFLVIPSTSFWWREHYSSFHKHLEAHYELVLQRDDTCCIYSLAQRRSNSLAEAHKVAQPQLLPSPKNEGAAKGTIEPKQHGPSALETGRSQEVLRASDNLTKYRELVGEVKAIAATRTPHNSTIAVVSKGDDELLTIDGRRAVHFPGDKNGAYTGYHPADSADAISQLMVAQRAGAKFLMIPSTAFWWLVYYRDFREHLDAYHCCRWNERQCIIYELSPCRSTFFGRILSRLMRLR